MRMGILFGWAAVRGPARVSNAVGAVQRLQTDDFFKVAQFAFSAADLQAIAIAADRDSSRVITTIFQTFEPIQ